MNRKSVIWLARKLGSKENAAVQWVDGGMFIQWTDLDGVNQSGSIKAPLARLLVRRLREALDSKSRT